MTGGIRYNRVAACIRTVGCGWQTVSAQAAAVKDSHVRGPSADCLSGSAHLTSPPWRCPAGAKLQSMEWNAVPVQTFPARYGSKHVPALATWLPAVVRLR